jgi:hypothetical protein
MLFLRSVVLILSLLLSLGQVSLTFAANVADYLPKEQNYNQQVTVPLSTLGFTVGERHPRHDQINDYFRQLAKSSKRVMLTEMGRTEQLRTQLLVTISSAENLANIENILVKRQVPFKKSDNVKEQTDDQPLVIWLGYSVHGDEASGASAAMVAAYHYAASQSKDIEALLKNTVIVLEPSVNPDGLDRFVNWASTFRHGSSNDDVNDIEHHQGWPSGRTNHYWFDLNRDWLLLTQKESQQRLKFFHQYQPHVVGDFHEMSHNTSYFFQPGVPSRTHPLTPKANGELTKLIAGYHAKALDQQQRLYFSKEVFDDFYYGKGSTYPDINGSIGILFEQATSRGVQQQSLNGLVTFEFGIQNHVLTSLSTVEGAWKNKKALKNYRQEFYKQSVKLAKKEKFKGYLIHADNDKHRLNTFLQTLNQHQINVYPLRNDFRHNGKTFNKELSYYLPLEQPQFRVIQALFNQQTSFQDNTFYDVSGWTLPLAMNIEFHQVERTRGLKVAEKAWIKPEEATTLLDNKAYAYVFEWHHSLAPQLLEKLLSSGIKAKVATKSFSSIVNGIERKFKVGSILLAAGWQQNKNWRDIVRHASEKSHIEIYSLSTGYNPQGVDFGSSSFKTLSPVNVMMIGGEKISQYEAGEIRYYLEKTIHLPVSIIEQHRVNTIDLSVYSHIILVDGDYQSFNDKTVQQLKTWIESGGVIFAQKRATKWLASKEILSADFVTRNQINQMYDVSQLSYQDQKKLAARKRIAGAIFQTKLDNSHPLTYGIETTHLPLFRNSTLIMKRPVEAFINVANYTDTPLMSGYTDRNLVNMIARSSAVIAHSLGQGRVVASTDNLVFRGYWLGSAKLLANSLYFSKAFDVPVTN